MPPSRYLSCTEACSELGIRPQTLYSYVSRGLVRSETGDQRRRTRQYYREDIERLRHQKELRAHPEAAAGRALRAGDPVLESALSRIDDDDLHYRGISVGELARGGTAEEVAALLWTGTGPGSSRDSPVKCGWRGWDRGSAWSWRRCQPSSGCRHCSR
jgi:citrate synthase